MAIALHHYPPLPLLLSLGDGYLDVLALQLHLRVLLGVLGIHLLCLLLLLGAMRDLGIYAKGQSYFTLMDSLMVLLLLGDILLGSGHLSLAHLLYAHPGLVKTPGCLPRGFWFTGLDFEVEVLRDLLLLGTSATLPRWTLLGRVRITYHTWVAVGCEVVLKGGVLHPWLLT